VKEIVRNEGVQSESAVLVGVELPDQQAGRDNLDELAGLVETAGAEVVGRLTQRRAAPDVTTFLGKGKLEQLELMVRATDADVVIFDNNLAPAQIRNLERALGVKVLDRTEVILDIFSSRARTHEARLAVELAQLEYSLPRLKRMWTHLSRIKAGVGMRGPGEKQLETDRRLVEKRIVELRRELSQVLRRKEREVAARSDRMTVSLVGYTNAGKSTLLNKLTGSDVLAEDKLFATLDTRTRRWQLPGWGPVLLSDTVGFIRDLPHSLIASFKATLEEARQADLLLHVADASNPAVIEQINSVYSVLEELGIREKDTILVLNQIDAIEDPGTLELLKQRYPMAMFVSARTGEGLTRLATAVSDALSHHFLDVDVETDVANGRLLAYLAKNGEILSRTYADQRVSVHCRIPRKYLGQIAAEDARVNLRGVGHDLARNGSAFSNGHSSENGATEVAEINIDEVA
jgi:GTP-binding protein HflX